MINITFPDQSVKQFDEGVTPLQIAQSISEGFARDVLASSVNEQEWDLSRPITSDAEVKFYKWDDPEGSMHFGIARLTCWQKLCRSCIPV